MELVYRPVVGAALATFRVMGWDVRTTGTEHIPTTGPAVIAANHIGYLDFVFLGMGAHRRGRLVRFMAMKEAFGHWLGGPLLRGMRHIPVDREGTPNSALRAAVGALRSGEVVGIHPEGGMSRSYVPAPGKTGAARMAIESGAPLVPTAVWGSQRILAAGHRPKWPRDVVVTVSFGPPIESGAGADPGEVTAELMANIGAQVDHAARAYPQHPRGPADRWWVPAHLGGTAPTVEEGLAMSRAASARRRARRAAGG
ncbi:MAG TPA: lysophospholipid acyltransferase family protein [Actinomycetota bacterium]|nr:lysophospholipid acyltransferase family protein [Actinomycetota bacterium]